MNNRNFVKGINILAKYLKDDDCDFAAEHDQFYMTDYESVIDHDDVEELKELGWVCDGDSWSAFV